MRDYDGEVYVAKQAITQEFYRSVRDGKTDTDRLAQLVDALNAAYDEQGNALVRKVKERDRMIQRLLNELAEASNR